MNYPVTLHLVALVIFIACFGCQGSKCPDERSGPEYSEQIRQVIEARNTQIQAWYSEGAIDSVAAHFSDDCIQMLPNQPPLLGNERFRKAWGQNVRIGKWDFDLQTVQVKASGDLATELGRYTLTFTPNEDSPIPAMTDTGNYLVLWERIDGEWAVVWDAPVSELALTGLDD